MVEWIDKKYFTRVQKSRRQIEPGFIFTPSSYTICSMIKVILALVVLVNGLYAYRLLADLIKHKADMWKEPGSHAFFMALGLVSQFLGTFGVSDFAFNTVAFRLTKTVEDKKIPGTLNAACVIPVAFMALAYITVIKVDVLTLVVLIIAQTTGSYLTPRIVVRLPVGKIRFGIAIGLLCAAFFILAGKLQLIPSGGSLTGLVGLKLALAALAVFIYGALNNIGIGSYAPTMATVYALGIDPRVAFPIMMGGCTFSCAVGSMEFVRLGGYSRKPTLWISTVGLLGVAAAVYLVKSMDVETIKWVVFVVVLYAALDLLAQALRSNKQAVQAG
jgi:uncharacterized membrane protein YfcA